MQISSSLPLSGSFEASQVRSRSAKSAESGGEPVDSFERGFDSKANVPGLKTMLQLLKKDSSFSFPPDSKSLKRMAGLAGKPLSGAELKEAKQHLKEIRQEMTGSGKAADPNEPKVQWLNLAESEVAGAAAGIKEMSRKLAMDSVKSSLPDSRPSVAGDAYFLNSDVPAGEMKRVYEALNELKSPDSSMISDGNSATPLMRGDIWKTKMSLLDEAVKNPVKNGVPVEIDAEYYELASDEMIGKLSKAASGGAHVKVVMDPGQFQNLGGGVYDASSIANRLSSFEKLKRGQNPENMAVTFYPVNEKLGGSAEIMHRKIFRVGEDVVFGGMNANKGSNENVDFALKMNGSAATKIGEMFAEDASYSAGKKMSDVYGDRTDILSDSSKTVVMSRYGIDSLISAAFAEKAGLDGTESSGERISKLSAAASAEGFNLSDIANFVDLDSNGKVEGTDVEKYLNGLGKSSVELKPEGRKLLMKLMNGAFSESCSADNVKNLKNAEPPEGKLPKGVKGTMKAAVASESVDRQAILLDTIDSAEKFIKISSFVMTEGIADVLIAKKKDMEAAGKPFDIEVVMDPGVYGYGGTPNEEGYKALEDAGIKVKWNLLERSSNDHDRKNHSKMMVTDKAVMTGSTNFSSKGLRDNWEAGTVVYFDKDDSNGARKAIVEDFDRMFSRDAVSVDTRRVAQERFKGYKGADKDVLVEKQRNKVIREFCGKIESYERQSAYYIGANSPELGTSSDVKGYEALDKLDDKYIDKMRSELSIWKDIKSYA